MGGHDDGGSDEARDLNGEGLAPLASGIAHPHRFPALIARCVDGQDVAAALGLARRTGLSAAVRAGGHSFLPGGRGAVPVIERLLAEYRGPRTTDRDVAPVTSHPSSSAGDRTGRCRAHRDRSVAMSVMSAPRDRCSSVATAKPIAISTVIAATTTSSST